MWGLLRKRCIQLSTAYLQHDPSYLFSQGRLYTKIRFPFFLDEKEVGHISVGERKSGEPYSSRDVQFLTTFANQAATALSRVRLYEEMEYHAQQLERVVEERTSKLRSLHAEQKRTMLDISHNLQTPLTVLKMKIDAWRKHAQYSDELSGVEQSIESLSVFIYELLALASLETSLEQESREQFSLSELLHEILEEIHIIAADQKITIESNIAPGVFLVGNRKRISEAILNLSNNAFKYLGDGPERKISFSLTAEASTTTIRIQDTGIGIPASDRIHIFERFYRVQQRTHRQVGGTGLGLAIVKQIVEQHGGTIDVQSEVGKGSTFMVTLPR